MVQSVIMRNLYPIVNLAAKQRMQTKMKYLDIIGATLFRWKWSQNWKHKGANAFGISTLLSYATTIVMFDIWFEETAMIICWEAKPCWHLTSAFPILSVFHIISNSIWAWRSLCNLGNAHKRKKNVNFWCIMKFLRMEDIFCLMPLIFLCGDA